LLDSLLQEIYNLIKRREPPVYKDRMESREEILANFQACSGIEDIGLALQFLEDSNWVLVDAVNRAIPAPPEPQAVDPIADRPVSPHPLNPSASNPDLSLPFVIPEDPPAFPPSFPSFPQMETPGQELFSSYLSSASIGPQPSVSNREAAGVSMASDFVSFSTSSRMLELHIEHGDQMIHLKVPDNTTIQVVKELLQEQTKIPPCQQELRGWSGNSLLPPLDRRYLSELNLPRENFLYLLTPDIPGSEAMAGSSDENTTEARLVLNVKDTVKDKMYNLTFSESTLVSAVKRDVATVTGIPVFRQVWTGWPDSTHDELSLAQSGVQDQHNFTVAQNAPDPDMPIVIDEESEAEISDNEFNAHEPETMEDDDMFNGGNQSPRSGMRGIQPLLPDHFGDEALAGIKFAEEFTNRYGHPSPQFFPGSLDDALNESCNKKSSDRKMLALYLHHDHSVLTNIFCTQVLCADAVIGLLNEHFVTWGWDLTFASNKQRLIDMINRHFGSIPASTLRNFALEKYPVVIIISKLKGSMEILKMIHGNTTLMEFMTEVLSATESYTQQLGLERHEERERNERNYVKDEQERAYQEAQMLDEVKEKEREDAEAEAKLQEQMDHAKRISEQEAKELEERQAQAEQNQAKQLLADEPSVEDSAPLANIRFRTPGETLTRRFYATDKLSTLLTFLTSVGYNHANFKVLSSWPRRDISVLDPGSSLEDLKLCPQETLTLECRRTDESDTE
jgi:hypothetical protein